MTDAKTQPGDASIDAYLASRASPAQLDDCRAVMAICARVTQQPARMWGPSIIGFGSYSYRYASGHGGQACLTGLAIRGKDLVVYLAADGPDQSALLASLGKHRLGKACLYFKRLSDIDPVVLEALIAASVADLRRRHPDPGAAPVPA